MDRIDLTERRRRLAVRHGLVGGGSPDVAGIARRLVALHSTDPATVYLSIRARSAGSISPGEIEKSLYERRDAVRMLGMRRTVFVVPVESAPVVQESTTARIARDQRARLLKLLTEAATVPDPDPWLADVEKSVLAVLADRNVPMSAAELGAVEPRLKTTIELAVGKPYAATQNITSRVLLVLAAQGEIVRGRPIGTWLSQQYRWSLLREWAPDAASVHPGGESAARAELARQWLAAFGPAPVSDLKWWTGWTMTQARQALAALDAVEVELDHGMGYVLPDDLDLTDDPDSWVALLPALDPTTMGWSDRSWFLGGHGQALFDTSGNAGPTVWLDGRVVGGWAQRSTGEIAIKLLEEIPQAAKARIDEEAAALSDWLGPVRVTPRFRTPTERALTS